MAREWDVVAAHAVLAPPAVLVSARRTLFGLVAELAGVGTQPPEVLDSPVTRFVLGNVLAGRPVPDPVALASTAVLGVRTIPAGPHALRIASDPAMRRALRGALETVARQVPGRPEPELLLAADGEAFDRAIDVITAGTAFARRTDAALADDLLAHVELVAVLNDRSSGRLGSASAREYPGLVVLPDPRSTTEAAEALIHEGAHQKVFDLGVTHDVLGHMARHAADYRPSWSDASWPLEQVLAGWHAYTCLARFAGRVPADVILHPGSLLPVAADRAAELLERLRLSGSNLGTDAHRLITAATGTPPVAGPAAAGRLSAGDPAEGFLRRPVPGTTMFVAGRQGTPPSVFWGRSDRTVSVELIARR